MITSWLVHVAQPKLMPKRTSFNQFRKTKKLALRVYCPNIYCGFKIAADNMVGRKKNYRDIYFQRQNLLYQNSLMTFSSHIFYLKQFFQFAEIELFVKKVGYICQFFFSFSLLISTKNLTGSEKNLCLVHLRTISIANF